MAILKCTLHDNQSFFSSKTEKYLIVSLRNHLNNGQFSATDLYFVQMCGSSFKCQFDDPKFTPS